MITRAMRESSSTSLLDGTLPLRPFHPDGFVGTMQADGQQVRVAALACDETRVVALSLVGFDTSIGVVFSRLWSSTAVPFTPADNWQEEWRGPEQLQRSGERYKQCVAHLEGTREVHALALVRTAHLTEGILHPPDLPEMQKPSDVPEQEQAQTPASRTLPAAKQAKPPVWVPHYVLGNWDEFGPNQQSFLGHLYALRVLFLHRHSEHPEWPVQWAEALWQRGLESELISPLAAIGIRAWRLSSDLLAWSALVGAGVRDGWLPWRDEGEGTLTACE
jgi:hypothetical protein